MTINANSYPDGHTNRFGDSNGTDASRARRLLSASGSEDAGGSAAAARLLEMTAQETDRWRSEAKGEADQLVANARAEAAELMRGARAEADRVVSAAREEAARELEDARVQAYRVREESETRRAGQEQEIARLDQVASEHREQLRQHLTEMLDRVDSARGDGQ